MTYKTKTTQVREHLSGNYGHGTIKNRADNHSIAHWAGICKGAASMRKIIELVLRTLAALGAIGAVAMVTAWAYGGPVWPVAAAGAVSLAFGWAAEAIESIRAELAQPQDDALACGNIKALLDAQAAGDAARRAIN